MLRRGSCATARDAERKSAEGSRASPQRWRTLGAAYTGTFAGSTEGQRNAFKNGRYIGGGNRAMAGDFGADPNGPRVRRKDTFRCPNVLVA